MTGQRLVTTTKKTRLPVQYTQAVKALQDCCNLDEAATFIDASEALAAWARIYRHNEAGRQARQLKLHAHRRMGQLAQTLAPNRGRKGKDGGREPGPIAKLKEAGLSRHSASAATCLGKMSEDDFELLIEQDRPPAPTSVAKRIRKPGELSAWDIMHQRPTPFASMAFISKSRPDGYAKMLDHEDAAAARRQAVQIIQWLNAFMRALPK